MTARIYEFATYELQSIFLSPIPGAEEIIISKLRFSDKRNSVAGHIIKNEYINST
jgi:hypothetical protein